MRIRTRLAFSGGVASAATVGALLVTGVFATSATLVAGDPTAPEASADSLSRFDGCAELRDWYVDHGVDDVGPYGWGGPIMYAYDAPATALDGVAPGTAEKSATDARASSDTGTNTQEVDVDEPDVAKTDGRLVVRLLDQRTLVVSDVTGDEPREIGRLSLPIDTYGAELLLVGDHVLVSEGAGGWGRPMPVEGGAGDIAVGKLPGPTGTRIVDVDLTDPAQPRIVHDDTYTGRQVSMRRYGDVVRLVTATPRPELVWVTPGKPGAGKISEDEATRRNRALVRATTIEDWLPAVVDNASGASKPLLDCTDVLHPAGWSGSETTTVTTYDVHDQGRRSAVGLTADGQVVYSSAGRLYVASSRVDPPSVWRRMYGAVRRDDLPARPQPVRTQLHAFALDGLGTRYLGSGHVTGSVRDRWSLDEHDGRLRVAWTRGDLRGGTDNGITVLAEQGGALVATGGIDRLGVDENIQSVRWFDDFAVLVTFRQVDPLYTIDLTDPGHPREIGQLKIPGYSGYLHPIGDDLLLGLGVDATEQGRSLGAQAAVFDIGHLADPRRVSQQGFGEQSSLPALGDPRGFTWLPDRRTGVTAVASWTGGRLRLVALHVDGNGTLEARDLATDVGWNARTLPLADGRVAVVDQGVRLLDVG